MCCYAEGLNLDKLTTNKGSKAPVEYTSLGDYQVFLLHPAITPYGLEVESKFHEKPYFAGGKASRNYLTLTLQITDGDAEALTKLDQTCKERSTLTGTWCDLVTEKNIRLRNTPLHKDPCHDGGRSPHVLSR